jgi:lipoprotein-releasing system ATP-binding protein
MLQVKDLHKKYGDLEILKGIDMEVGQGELVSIVGASGAGKSTLLQIIGTLDSADRGQILVDGQDVTKFNDKGLSKFRNQTLGFVFQFHNLLPEFTALENIMMPGMIGGRPKKAVSERALYLLDLLGLSHRVDHKPSTLSGGEQQRVSVARALINEPALILADEPSGNLDSQNADQLHNLFLQLRKDFNQTFIVVTHNKDLANLSDRSFRIKDGLIKEMPVSKAE